MFTSSTDADVFDGGWSVDVPIEADGERPCVWLLYRFWDKFGRLLYIGQTRQDAVARWLQHVKDQPWGHLIRRMEADQVEFASEAEARAAEKAAIHAELPLCNKEHNYGNPNRWVFDDVPAAARRTRARVVVPDPVRGRLLSGRRIAYACVLAIWVAVDGVTYSTISPRAPGLHGMAISSLMTAFVFGVTWQKTRRIGRPRRRRRRYR